MSDLIELRGGFGTRDMRLDRLIQFDEASRSYPIRELFQNKKPRSYTWRCNARFDQGREGACVAFALGHELAARPAEVQGLHYARLIQLYHEAQRIDPWPGGSYPGASPRYEGTSVLAGVKAAHRMGLFESYRWAFGLQDLILGVGRNGPAIVGTNWYSGMYDPDAKGYLNPTGQIVGGHAWLVDQVDVRNSRFGMLNSWGNRWGRNGRAWITFDNMGKLLSERGEAVFLLKRRSKAA